MLEVTGSKANKYKLSNVELIKVDIEVPQKIKIAEGSCDLIIISSIIFQLQDKNIIFESAKKILKKRGNILIIEWQPEGPLGPDKNLRLSKEKVIKLSEDNGFILDKEVDAGHFHYGLLIKIKNKHS
jgi:ubiquinone/menaquinone biosynthesis C-methylase UbiE